jgi:endonuclease/exonuclease/phosphatase family metal-dependent hydrolase
MILFPNKINRTIFCIIFLLCSWTTVIAQVKLVSWNIENFGKSKSEVEINFIANTLKNYDIIAIQEVAAGYGGAQAVARLADELNRKGAKWDYTISDPTASSAYKTERYAFIWKTAHLKKMGRAWLEKKYHLEIDREPLLLHFSIQE